MSTQDQARDDFQAMTPSDTVRFLHEADGNVRLVRIENIYGAHLNVFMSPDRLAALSYVLACSEEALRERFPAVIANPQRRRLVPIQHRPGSQPELT